MHYKRKTSSPKISAYDSIYFNWNKVQHVVTQGSRLGLFLSLLYGNKLLPNSNIWGPFAKFVDSPCYSESELCGGAVTASFSKYLPWQVMHFLQCPTHFLKTCCRLLITDISCLRVPFLWLEKPRNRMGWVLNWMLCLAWKKWIGRAALEHPLFCQN
jgi:hypothetical protein